MANSKYEYVRTFERPDSILPNTWIVIRLDGRGFHKLSAKYGFVKPNDVRALDLMNAAASGVMKEIQELSVAYGQSDEYSFIFKPSTTLFERRESKLTTTVVSTFTSYYTHLWPTFFPDTALSSPLPSFDGRAVVYPSLQNLKDYLSWRQADCHINNLYNTTFWALVNQGQLSPQVAEKELMGTYSKDKNEILFSRFGINYNKEPEIFRKGSVIYRNEKLSSKQHLDSRPLHSKDSHSEIPSLTSAAPQSPHQILKPLSKTQREKERECRADANITIKHVDIIRDVFWLDQPWILEA